MNVFQDIISSLGITERIKKKLISFFDHNIVMQHLIYTLEVISFSWQNPLSNKEYKRVFFFFFFFFFVSDKCPVLQWWVTNNNKKKPSEEIKTFKLWESATAPEVMFNADFNRRLRSFYRLYRHFHSLNRLFRLTNLPP